MEPAKTETKLHLFCGKAGSGKTALLVDIADDLTETGVQPVGGEAGRDQAGLGGQPGV